MKRIKSPAALARSPSSSSSSISRASNRHTSFGAGRTVLMNNLAIGRASLTHGFVVFESDLSFGSNKSPVRIQLTPFLT